MLAYYRKVWKTAVADAVAFWTTHKIATTLPGPIIGFAATWVVLGGIRSWMDFWRAVEIAALSGLSGFMITLLVSLARAPKLLNDERLSDIRDRDEANQQIRQAFSAESSDLKKQIDSLMAMTADRDAELEELKKPKRTVAEEHHYAEAQLALTKLGEDGAVALRHLATHEALTFAALVDPPIPKGMSARALHEILALCVAENLATCQTVKNPGGIDYIYKIAPGMKSALDDLLYAAE